MISLYKKYLYKYPIISDTNVYSRRRAPPATGGWHCPHFLKEADHPTGALPHHHHPSHPHNYHHNHCRIGVMIFPQKTQIFWAVFFCKIPLNKISKQHQSYRGSAFAPDRNLS